MKPQLWQAILLVGAGGFVGAVARMLLATFVDRFHETEFPWGIFAANALGCLIIGAAFGVLDQLDPPHPEWRLVLITGFLGSLTTFSTFSNDTLNLIRKGQLGLGLANIALSVIVGLFAVWVGYTIASAARR
ncbi:MAG: fluoride efflux transporter CrcB [Verrucomicrobiota bacterium]